MGSGDPMTSCRPECSQLSDCPFNRQCQKARCVDPCLINIETGHLGSNLHDIHIQKVANTLFSMSMNSVLPYNLLFFFWDISFLLCNYVRMLQVGPLAA
jgi:hypothetical protein